jgi:hypothetical protein
MDRPAIWAAGVGALGVIPRSTTSMLPWLWVLLGLVGFQVVILVVTGRSRPPRAQPSEAETDWKAVEDDLAKMLGPAMRELVGTCGGRSPDGERIRALAQSLADRAGASHGLESSGADALARALGDELVRIAEPVPTT